MSQKERKKKKKRGWRWGEEGGRETHKPISRKKKKIWLVSGPVGAEELAPRGGPGCLREGEEQAMRR